VPWKHASLAACLRQLSLSLFLWCTARRGLWDTWQHRSSPLRKAEPRAVGHVVAPEIPSQEGRALSRGTRGSTGAHLSKEAWSTAAGHVAAPEPTSAGRCGPKLQLTWQRVDACAALVFRVLTLSEAKAELLAFAEVIVRTHCNCHHAAPYPHAAGDDNRKHWNSSSR
jgi:hypothetical protein